MTSNRIISKLVFLGTLFLISIVNISCAQTQTNKLQKADKIDEIINIYAQNNKFNGTALVAQQGEVIYKKGFGFANMEWETANQADTKHSLASITKQFTAMLIVQLASEGKLDLQAPITKYLPDYPNETGDIITIHQLLTHSSGIPDYGAFPNYRDLERERYRPNQIIELFNLLPLDFTPGERYNYSNSGYIVLGVIIEKLTGKSYADVLHEKIFTPLKMENSGYNYQRNVLKNRSSAYYQSWGNYFNTNFLDMSLVYAAGALYSTVEDLYLWDQALYTEQLVPNKYIDLVFKKHIEARRRMYGYGWFIHEMPGKGGEQNEIMSHGGGFDGVRTLITRIPTNKSLIVLLNNVESPSLREITETINSILHDQPYELPKRSIANSLSASIKNGGIEEGIKTFNRIKNDQAYYKDESEMIVLGYKLLHADRTEEASSVFELCIQAFPNSFNVYDSYAEALLSIGKKEEAISYYKKSIEMNPGNQNGIDVLKRMGVNIDHLITIVPNEYLKLVEGKYTTTELPGTNEDQWTIALREENGALFYTQNGREHELIPISDNEFVSQYTGASLIFNTKDKKKIGFKFSGDIQFSKVE